MEVLWSPWRYRYVTGGPVQGCIFCTKPAENRDADHFILYRGLHNFVILNLYPYSTGHLMVVPYRHLALFEDLESAASAELTELTQVACRCLRHVYNPHGINLGMNIGECAGAGVAGHIHMHVLPRWPGDVNFMTAVAETRVLPEDLPTTYEKLRLAFSKAT